MCEVIAKKMLAVIQRCQLFPKSEAKFMKYAAQSNCNAMWQLFQDCLKSGPDVGPSMRRRGVGHTQDGGLMRRTPIRNGDFHEIALATDSVNLHESRTDESPEAYYRSDESRRHAT
jgi:hypothetical protein